MDNATIFKEFLQNLEIKNQEQIVNRFNTITKTLNKFFFEHDSESDNSILVGSLGRKTGVNGISDLDMFFILDNNEFTRYNNYENNGQSSLLQDVKNAISKTYPTTDIRGDGQVVVVSFVDSEIEVCPVFRQEDGKYKYPDSHNGGSWKFTNPIPEIEEFDRFDIITNYNLRKLSKTVRAWKNRCGVVIGGLMIDTLCHDFLRSNEKIQKIELSNWDQLLLCFFNYLKDIDPVRKYWLAPGSQQKVYKKNSNFISKAKKAYSLIKEAIEKKDNDTVYSIWRKVFGTVFPYPKELREMSINYTPKEEYIEDLFPTDIRYILRINCEVTQAGFRTEYLRNLFGRLKVDKKLKFFIERNDVPKPYFIKWKVKNEGEIANKRKDFRGQIVNDNGNEIKNENSRFAGPHYVECYIIKNNVCVARDRIEVPISNLS